MLSRATDACKWMGRKMLQRWLVAVVALCVIAIALVHSPGGGIRQRRAWGPGGRPPHILFVVLDDMGSHDLGLHGTGIHTPVMDRMVEDGVFLSNYYVLPACSPTRAALMSGRYPLHTGVNNIIFEGSTVGLPLDEETLPEVLARGGYKRHIVGKWHMGSARWEQMPTFRGFESFYGFVNGMEDFFMHRAGGAHDFRYDDREKCGPGCSRVVDERGRYSTHLYAKAAIDLIEKHDEEDPLFLYLSFNAPHAPEQVPEEYERRYKNKNWTPFRRTYAGMLTCADEAIGNVTAALKARGMWEDTIVIGTTDNGGPTETCVVSAASNWPLRGGKCSLWEGGTRGDGFLSGPALNRYGIPQGSNGNLFHVVDWLPTLAEIAMVQPQGKPLDGVSQLRSLAQGGAARHDAYLGSIPWPVPATEEGQAAVYKNWKVVKGSPGLGGWVGPDGSARGTPEEEIWAQEMTEEARLLAMRNMNFSYQQLHQWHLYDLSKDSGERENLANRKQYAAQMAEMKELLESYESTRVPQQKDDPRCPFSREQWVYVEGLGPVWAPWCHASREVLLYR